MTPCRKFGDIPGYGGEDSWPETGADACTQRTGISQASGLLIGVNGSHHCGAIELPKPGYLTEIDVGAGGGLRQVMHRRIKCARASRVKTPHRMLPGLALFVGQGAGGSVQELLVTPPLVRDNRCGCGARLGNKMELGMPRLPGVRHQRQLLAYTLFKSSGEG